MTILDRLTLPILLEKNIFN